MQLKWKDAVKHSQQITCFINIGIYRDLIEMPRLILEIGHGEAQSLTTWMRWNKRLPLPHNHPLPHAPPPTLQKKMQMSFVTIRQYGKCVCKNLLLHWSRCHFTKSLTVYFCDTMAWLTFDPRGAPFCCKRWVTRDMLEVKKFIFVGSFGQSSVVTLLLVFLGQCCRCLTDSLWATRCLRARCQWPPVRLVVNSLVSCSCKEFSVLSVHCCS